MARDNIYIRFRSRLDYHPGFNVRDVDYITYKIQWAPSHWAFLLQFYNWTLSLGFSCAFGAMFSKTWRVHKIFTNKKIQRMVCYNGPPFKNAISKIAFWGLFIWPVRVKGQKPSLFCVYVCVCGLCLLWPLKCMSEFMVSKVWPLTIDPYRLTQNAILKIGSLSGGIFYTVCFVCILIFEIAMIMFLSKKSPALHTFLPRNILQVSHIH